MIPGSPERDCDPAKEREELKAFADEAFNSVTALEIEYGILRESPEQRQRCFFYFRDPLPYDSMPAELAEQYSDAHATDSDAPARADALKALKRRLEDDPELEPRIRHYPAGWDPSQGRVNDLEAWGEQVFQDIWGVSVTNAPGRGKSALFVHLHKRLIPCTTLTLPLHYPYTTLTLPLHYPRTTILMAFIVVNLKRSSAGSFLFCSLCGVALSRDESASRGGTANAKTA